MERQVKTTGPFGIGSMIHVIHMTDDVAELTAWYEDVFDAVTFMGTDELNYLPPEKRWATLVMVSDYCIEVMAPEMPVDPATPVGRFYNRFGRHFHSTGYRVADLEGLAKHLTDNEVTIGKPGGGPVEDARRKSATSTRAPVRPMGSWSSAAVRRCATISDFGLSGRR